MKSSDILLKARDVWAIDHKNELENYLTRNFIQMSQGPMS